MVTAYMEDAVQSHRLITSRPPTHPSPKNSFVLNYKKIPYTTDFIGFPSIAATLSAAGAPPTRTADLRYSVPALIDSDGSTVLADSAVIADHLERTHPAPTIYPHGRAAQMRWADGVMGALAGVLAPIVVPATARILPEADAEYFVRTRKLIFGTCLLLMSNAERG